MNFRNTALKIALSSFLQSDPLVFNDFDLLKHMELVSESTNAPQMLVAPTKLGASAF